MTPSCASCGAPTGDQAYLCRDCTAALGGALRQIPGGDGLAYHLGVSLTRQAVTGDRAPSRSRETPLPYDERTARVMAHLHGILAGWVRVLTEAG